MSFMAAILFRLAVMAVMLYTVFEGSVCMRHQPRHGVLILARDTVSKDHYAATRCYMTFFICSRSLHAFWWGIRRNNGVNPAAS
ncbi:hypothetical protein BJY52DRAFT_83557 [Lactarius psammicola]|nr:hypothetical protein BJY52DRAFT_83557 [Lactarius psammicola]